MNYDAARQMAVTKMETALAEARRWERFIAMYDELKPTSESPLTGVLASKETRRKRGTSGAIRETEKRVVELLAETMRPLQTVEIYDALVAEGYAIDGKDPILVLSSRLSRSTLVVSSRPFGWTLVDATKVSQNSQTDMT
jgi:hypothetical protein